MKISELIHELRACQREYGDIEVVCIPDHKYDEPDLTSGGERFDVREAVGGQAPKGRKVLHI